MAGNGETCKRAELHWNYIPIDQMNYFYDCTVQVILTCVSGSRPESYDFSTSPFKDFPGTKGKKFFGSGFIFHQLPHQESPERCHCIPCVPNTVTPSFSRFYVVVTSSHVIYDYFEATRSQFRCFFNIDKQEQEDFLYGVDYLSKRKPEYGYEEMSGKKDGTEEMVFVKCVTHDEGLAKRIDEQLKVSSKIIKYGQYRHLQRPMLLVSHPHKLNKKISIGNVTGYKVYLSETFHPDVRNKFSNHAVCVLPYKQFLEINWKQLFSCVGDNNDHNGNNSLELKQYLKTDWEITVSRSENHPEIKLHFHNKSNGSIEVVPDPEVKFCFQLPRNTTFTLPEKASFAFYQDNYNLLHFSPGTVFELDEGEEIIVPEKACFHDTNYLNHHNGYIEYETMSCTSSSGGSVVVRGEFGNSIIIPHSGRAGGNQKTGHCPIYIEKWIEQNFRFETIYSG